MKLRPFVIALAALLAAAPLAANTATSDPRASAVVRVARPNVAQFYRGTVLFVRPVADGAHVGFIINRPTDVTLSSLFPKHVP